MRSSVWLSVIFVGIRCFVIAVVQKGLVSQGCQVGQYSLQEIKKFCDDLRRMPLPDANRARHFIEICSARLGHFEPQPPFRGPFGNALDLLCVENGINAMNEPITTILVSPSLPSRDELSLLDPAMDVYPIALRKA